MATSSTRARTRFGTAGALTAVLCLLTCQPPARADSTCDGVRMPEREHVFGMNLVLNGMGVRRVTFLNIHVYVAGLYVQERTRDSRQILRTDQAKAFAMQLLRDADRERANAMMQEQVLKTAGAQREAALASLRRFQRLLPEMRKGHRLRVAYRAGYGLEVRHDGKLLGVHKDDAFAQLIFRTWIGPTPTDEDLKTGLLGGECD